jgi:hypothetical protein
MLIYIYMLYPGYDCLKRVKVASFVNDLLGEGVQVQVERQLDLGTRDFDVMNGGVATGGVAHTREFIVNPQSPEINHLPSTQDETAESLLPNTRLLNVDMRLPDNVFAWSCLHKCLLGGEFGRSFYVRAQGYNLCIFWSMITYLLFMSMLVKFEGSVDFVVALDAIVRIIFILAAIIVQIFIAYSVNRNASGQKAQLLTEKFSIQGQLSSLNDITAATEQQMRNTCEMLDSVREQIDLRGDEDPMRVMALPAAPPAITFALGVSGLALSFAFDAWSNGYLEIVM